MNGNTRVKALEERGYKIDQLPRETYPSGGGGGRGGGGGGGGGRPWFNSTPKRPLS